MLLNSYIEWTEDLGVDSGAIDADHRQLIALINRVYSASRTDFDDDDLGDILCELAEYSNSHFNREERLMDSIGYPHRCEHIRQHNSFIGTLSRLIASFERGTVIPSEILDFVASWFMMHIRVSDQALGRYVQQSGTLR